MPRVVTVAPRGAPVAVRFVCVLIGIMVVLLYKRVVVSTLLGAGGQAVITLLLPLVVVVVLIGSHQAASLHWRVVADVIAVFISLALLKGHRYQLFLHVLFSILIYSKVIFWLSPKPSLTCSPVMAVGYGESTVEPRLRPSRGFSGVLREV